MKAVQIQSYGGPEVVEIVDLPKPEPTADQVLVRAHSLNARTGAIAGRNYAEVVERYRLGAFGN